MAALLVAAKQEAFEESTRLKNQFRTLDEDEVEFLDSVLESTRAKEDAVRKETTEQLDLFRRQQEEADRALVRDSANGTDLTASRGAASPPADETNWVVSGKKRKRVQERDKEGLKGIKLKKSSSTVDKSTSLDTASPSTLSTFKRKEVPKSTQAPRRVESDQKINQSPSATSADMSTKSPAKSRVSPKNTEVPQKGTLPGLGLANYSSEDDD